MERSILVGIDGSIASRAAVAWAVERGEGSGAQVALLSVVDDEWGTISDRDLAELRTTAEQMVARELEYAREQADAVAVSARVEVGSPMLVLASEAAGHESVAIGTHKMGSFHGHALGSRGLQLAAMASVPTIIVPISTSTGRSGVAVGLGDEPGWIDPVRYAAREAVRLGERLMLIRSGGPDATDDERALGLVREIPETSELTAGIVVRRSTSSPGEALAAVSRRAVLTVSGRPTAPGTQGFRPLGRTNNDLLMNAGGPVMIAPFLVGAPVTG
ncbi:universal stress protein [Agromyces sp. NPDC049794]|uniref:universal stress protein n=1 Tax=unclassified Agromyces TaxID=2639701 RepID=UPI0033DA7318